MGTRVFKPRRGSSTNMNNAPKSDLILAPGELFIEYPDTGVGTGKCKMKIGDEAGSTYGALPYAFGEDISYSDVIVEPNASLTVEDALDGATSGTTLMEVLGALKQAISLAVENTGESISSYITAGSSAYIKNVSISGSGANRILNVTKGDGSITSSNVADTVYTVGTSTKLGTTKLYSSKGTNTDGAMTQAAINNNYFPLSGGSVSGTITASGKITANGGLSVAGQASAITFSGNGSALTGVMHNISISQNLYSIPYTVPPESINIEAGSVTVTLPGTYVGIGSYYLQITSGAKVSLTGIKFDSSTNKIKVYMSNSESATIGSTEGEESGTEGSTDEESSTEPTVVGDATGTVFVFLNTLSYS